VLGIDRTSSGMMTYETAESLPVLAATFTLLFVALVAIGYCALKLKDNGWRFSINAMLMLLTAVAAICMFVKIAMILPPGVK
jgi:hypothetical protein